MPRLTGNAVVKGGLAGLLLAALALVVWPAGKLLAVAVGYAAEHVLSGAGKQGRDYDVD